MGLGGGNQLQAVVNVTHVFRINTSRVAPSSSGPRVGAGKLHILSLRDFRGWGHRMGYPGRGSGRRSDFRANVRFRRGGIALIDSKHAIAHNKVMVIDGKTLITGSFNFTKAAEEKNAEILLILDNAELVNVYMDNWEKHKKHSEEY